MEIPWGAPLHPRALPRLRAALLLASTYQLLRGPLHPSSHPHPPRSRHSLACQSSLLPAHAVYPGISPHSWLPLIWSFPETLHFRVCTPVCSTPCHPSKGGCFGDKAFLSCLWFFLKLWTETSVSLPPTLVLPTLQDTVRCPCPSGTLQTRGSQTQLSPSFLTLNSGLAPAPLMQPQALLPVPSGQGSPS